MTKEQKMEMLMINSYGFTVASIVEESKQRKRNNDSISQHNSTDQSKSSS